MFYLLIATMNVYRASVSCIVNDFSRRGVVAGTGGHGARQKRAKGGWKMCTVTENKDGLKVGWGH